MKLIHSSYEILDQEAGLQGVYRQIERAGRTCYKSENRMTDDSAEKFVNAMIKSGHGAMLEHGTVYLNIPTNIDVAGVYLDNISTWTRYKWYTNNEGKSYWAITTNYRVLVDNGWLDDLKYLCEPTEYHERRYTVKFICDRGVSHELVRHRVFSFAQESQRYCNYSKEKYGKEITFIIPSWMSAFEDYEEYYGVPNNDGNAIIRPLGDEGAALQYYDFLYGLKYAEDSYFSLIELGQTPQQARGVLPNATKTEIVMTGFISDWEHFFNLRVLGTTGKPHPDMKALAEPLMREFTQREMLYL